jgi:internalin A
MLEITKLAVSRPLHLNQEQKMSADKTQIWNGDRIDGDKVMGDKVAGNKVQIGTVQGDAVAGNKIVNSQTMTQTAQDIKILVNQYSPDYDTTTQSGKMGLSGKVLESVEKNPTLKSRTVKALTEAGKKAFEEAIDHPVAKVLVAGLEGFMEG